MSAFKTLRRLVAVLLFAGAGIAAEMRYPGPCPLVAIQAKRRALR
ncbi:hypothetical protein [Pseudoduganella umbonata]|uniref:Uncharacterized protein n=1 Tax=Pseudoduganella umbonata TaxID=864828 RepID=A0A7W5EHK2_9BURK|nr:hypothetical protein [Pseudoduganella umbonata]MBB3224865.1 hypothetical protein [Pseudoduganella umbonata]